MKTSLSIIIFTLSILLSTSLLFSNKYSIVKTISECNTINEWRISSLGGTTASLNTKKINNSKVLEASFNMVRPDFLTENVSSELTLDFKNPQFKIKKDEALLISILWQGGENNLKVELGDKDNVTKVVYFFHMNRKKSSQNIIITHDNLAYINKGKLKRNFYDDIIKFKLTTFYSWTPGPGKIYLKGIYVIKKPKPEHPTISVSQLGYRSQDKKRVIIRWATKKDLNGSFEVIKLPSHRIVYKGSLKTSSFKDWPGKYLKGDFSKLQKKGRYIVKIKLNDKSYYSEPFDVLPNIYENKTMKMAMDHFHLLRSDDPKSCGYSELGGFRDTGTMYARYLDTNPHAVFGLATYVLARRTKKERANKDRFALEELRYGVESMLLWQKNDGSVTAAIRRNPDLYFHNQLPDDSKYPWNLDTPYQVPLKYVAAMATASRAFSFYDTELSDKALRAAIKSLKKSESKKISKHSTEQGKYLWALMELYKTTKKKSYLDKARETVKKLIKRQFLDYTRVNKKVCGNISASVKSINFSYQYKFIHSAGIYLGMIDYLSFLKPDDPLYADLRYALATFTHYYLLRMSSLTPYKQIAEGIEEGKKGRYYVSYFHPPTGNLGTESHGLNCDHLAYALIGIRLAKILNNKELEHFAVDQIQWIFGVNPLGLSQMTGIGAYQGESLDQYVGLKPIYGGIMNGIVGHHGMIPFWAKHWISGEYWLPHNSYYMALVGELEHIKRDYSKKKNFKVSINTPSSINGSEDTKIDIEIRNLHSKRKKGTILIQARGSYIINKKIKINLQADEDREISIDLKSTGKRAPGLIMIVYQNEVIGEKMIHPAFPKLDIPDYDHLKKARIASVTASSIQSGEKNVLPKNVMDGSLSTRWSSQFNDPQWLTITLDKTRSIKRILLYWETAFAEKYIIETSKDKKNWKTVYSTHDEDGGKDDIVFKKPVQTKYLRLKGLKRGTVHGYSLYEMEIYE